jgi:adenosine kinase
MASGVPLNGAILGMCNPLLDISSEVPAEFLEKYDVKLNNAILAEDKHIPLYEELIEKFPVQYIAGGATLNSIRVAQWMLGVPGSTAYFGAIGEDKFGETLGKDYQHVQMTQCIIHLIVVLLFSLEQCAMDDGLNMVLQKTPGVATGTCAVLINGGERSLVANLAAANTFTSAHLETTGAKSAVEKAQIVYTSGFFLTVSVDSIVNVCKHVVENNKIYCLNLSAPFIVQFFGDQLATALQYADYVFANESEAATYGEVKGLGSDLATIAMKIAALPKASGCRPRTVVFTQGASATIVCHLGKVTTYPVDPLPANQLVDTNGAGDAFVGGFLSQMVQGKDLSECVRAGHYASRVIIQRSGCTFPKECDFM